MASMEKDFFWGCELSKDKKEYSWDSEDEELSKADIEQKLVVSQACLGPKAKANEKNLVQVTTTDSSDSSVTFTILSLTSGKTDQCRLSLAFPSSATFNLIEGSGPVHLTGTVYQELYLLDDEEESDEDEDEMVKSEANVGAKKRPLASETPKGPPKKLARVEVDKEESEEEDDDDDDEGESTEESTKMEVDTKQKQNKTEQTPKTSKKKQEGKDVKVKKKDTEEDSEEDEESEDESDEDDDEEEESDEDESEEDESDEDDDEEEDESDEDEITTSLTAKKQEAKGAKKKPITNGVVKQDKKNKQEKSKTPAQQPSTPKTGANRDEVKKSGSKTPQPLDMDKMKERLLKTPNLPKKVDKFKNYMKNSYKVTDDAELTKIWEWVKANK